jgi:hypothetical protein
MTGSYLKDLIQIKDYQIEALQKENQRLVTHLYELCDKDCPEEYRQVVLSSLVERYAKESRD